MARFPIGSRVVLTAAALRALPALVSHDIGRCWSVLECYCALCASGSHVCTDQRSYDDAGWRHVVASSLRQVGQIELTEFASVAVYHGCSR